MFANDVADNPLDTSLGESAPATDGARRFWPAPRRLALGLTPTPRTGLTLLLFGMAFGPHGLNVLSDRVLAFLDPAVSVALAALGVFVGLDLRLRRPRENRLLAVASVEAAVTLGVVAGAVIAFHRWSATPGPIPWLLALLLGICAAPSSTAADRPDDSRHDVAIRMGDLDDVLPIALSMLALGWARSAAPVEAASLVGQSATIAVVIALAIWLLVGQTTSDSDRRVFLIGGLLLLGGAASHLSVSALFAGVVAGALWNLTRSDVVERIRRDMVYMQHPLMVLLLVVAGARLVVTPQLAGLTVAYFVFRVLGKLLGGAIAGWLMPGKLPREFGMLLGAPGLLGIAIAMDVLQATGESGVATALFGIVLVGSLASEALSLASSRLEGRP